MKKSLNLTQKLINAHLLSGKMIPGEEIALKIDQVLTQDATGTLVMLELEAMEVEKIKPELAVQYVDHNILQGDYKNADDHIFLRSAAKKFGFWFSPPGNGVSHPVHMERFALPGKTLVGSDSHTPASGAMGMIALGAGGLDVAFVLIGEPLYIKMPKILGVKVTGKLQDWTSAKDVVLEMLRRYGVKGCKNLIIEYYGDGLQNLSAMDRHVIANMGTEMGATTSVFPSDEEIRRFLKSQQRDADWISLGADEGAGYDLNDEINLSEIEPLIALPSSPGNVVKVKEVEGRPVYQCVVGSSANPGFRDFWIVGEILKGRRIHERISLDVNPTSRQVIENLIETESFLSLVHSGARFHQAGCNGCIGMGQAPATGKISLRTVPRNFPGRSGTLDDLVYLCSPETAAAAALTGQITDPRDLEKIFNISYPIYNHPVREIINTQMLIPPVQDGEEVPLEKGPNIKALPKFEALKSEYSVPVLLKMLDNISTDEILKAGAKVLPSRSNIPEISRWTYAAINENFYNEALVAKETFGGHVVVAGENYAQGSSREHAAICPRYLGQVAVIAMSYARLGWQNLINFGIVPFEFKNKSDYETIEQGDVLKFENLIEILSKNTSTVVINQTKNLEYELKHDLSTRQIQVVLKGGVVNYFKIPSTKPDASNTLDVF